MLEEIIREIEEMDYPRDEICRDLREERIKDRGGAAAFGFGEAQERIIEIIRSHMENNGWIPCEKGLPGAWDIDPDLDPEDITWPEYIATIKDCSEATTLHYDFQEKTWFDDNGYTYEVVAWQNLPDAYRPKYFSGQKSVGEDYKQQIMERFLKVE